MPGYSVAGTVGAQVLAGENVIEIDRFTKVPCRLIKQLNVNLRVENLSFSARIKKINVLDADAKGIMQLVSNCKAKNGTLLSKCQLCWFMVKKEKWSLLKQ